MVSSPVSIRPEARTQILDTLHTQKIPAEYGLRVGVRGGGCGASWLLGFDLPGPTDELYLVDGIRVIIDRRHLLYVLDAIIGFEQSEEGWGFVVDRPLATASTEQIVQ
ncbi:iron-sulfur cluster assembly accessory protein [Fibrella sp. HMF5335]|uniref:Iron-sulfur cluster assembly accessory protein n=1 Tax=Fibrella rubiginis TaxID=2817060 RepID=A0A939GL45_9BACT|nr:iron-sulfur cluster assembly accessory protein [Fibrella rubiginis]MBO0938403.1 iron-sulfur cluster assembly accessory protein [Fibrella rubiginis]